VLSSEPAVALKPKSSRISGNTGPTEVVNGRSVIATKNSGIALKIKSCFSSICFSLKTHTLLYLEVTLNIAGTLNVIASVTSYRFCKEVTPTRPT
jgi:hypothetical protein